MTAAKSDFGRAVADEFRGIREAVEARPVKPPEGEAQPVGGIDRSVKEQVISDIDRAIEHHESRVPFPVGGLSCTP